MIKNLLGDDDDRNAEMSETPVKSAVPQSGLGLFDPDPEFRDEDAIKDENYVLSQTEPENFAETTRKSGLAWSAGIALFASVVFMLVIGWGADLLFGSSPWGLVAGIVVGSLIGFVQFFRLTSQIFPK